MSAIPAAWLTLPATHGNHVTGHGWCHVCERDNVPLNDHGECANEFACARAWSALPPRRRRRAPA